MVDLMPSRSTTERAQVLLVTTFGIAVLFVLLAMVLNASAFTHTMATRQGDDGGDAVRFSAAAVEGVNGSVEYVNTHNDTDYTTLETELDESVAAWSASANGYAVRGGERVTVSVLDTTFASRMAQDDDTRAMQSAADADDWTLATGVTEIRTAKFTVDSSSLVEPAEHSKTSDLHNASAFHVLVDGSDDWELFVYQKDGDVYVAVDDADGNFGKCSPVPTGSDVSIDLVNATVDGNSCSQLQDFDDAGSSYSVRYRNGGNAVGTYSILVDDTAVTSNFGSAEDGEPYVDPAIDTVTVRITSTTAQTDYATEATVEAGETHG